MFGPVPSAGSDNFSKPSGFGWGTRRKRMERRMWEEGRKDMRFVDDPIPEQDEEDEEIAHHIRMAFRNCHRDLSLNPAQCMNMGTMEYLEQFGIHPFKFL